MKPFIDDKKAVIRGKIENCADGIIPTAMLVNHKPTKEELTSHLANNSLLTAPTFISLMGIGVDIQTHWRLQRDETKEHIRELLEFRDYLTDKELKTLGDLQNCQFFFDINGIFPMTDTPDVRMKLANSLWEAIEIARKLS